MPRCRHGYFHVVNNDFTEWKMYAIGGSADPTINSQGNRYIAPPNADSKEVTYSKYIFRLNLINILLFWSICLCVFRTQHVILVCVIYQIMMKYLGFVW